MEKPFSAACERNRIPILRVLQDLVTAEDRMLLEIGSGTGQHAVYLAPHFPHLIWVTSDVAQNHAGIRMWLEESGAPNIIGPGEFEVGVSDFPNGHFDVVFTANTFHIMSWNNVCQLIEMLGKNLKPGTKVLIYGPFNYDGKFTSQSNEEFHRSLQEKDPAMGIRNFEDVCGEMEKHGLSLIRDYEMPANNRCLYFQKQNLIQ